jgi:hypothetical protein
MDEVLKVLASEAQRQVAREIRSRPGQRQIDMLGPLGFGEKGKGTLSKLLAPLEEAGIVKRDDGRYYPVASDALGRLLIAAADVDVGAQGVRFARAREAEGDAKRLAEELRAELG